LTKVNGFASNPKVPAFGGLISAATPKGVASLKQFFKMLIKPLPSNGRCLEANHFLLFKVLHRKSIYLSCNHLPVNQRTKVLGYKYTKMFEKTNN
jgi:hypothetical protein